MTETTFKTDALGFASKPWATFHIYDKEVEIRICEDTHPVGKNLLRGKDTKKWIVKSHFCAYAELENSHILSDTFLGYPTYRHADWVGVDTAHAFNEGQTGAQKLASALHQIEGIIESWRKATQSGVY